MWMMFLACAPTKDGDANNGALEHTGEPTGETDSGITDTADSTDTGDSGQMVVPAGKRVLGLEVNPSDVFDFGKELQAAQDVGVGAVQLTMHWGTLEPDKGAIDTEYLAFGLEYYRKAGVDVVLSIPTIDTVTVSAPADLREGLLDGSLSWSDEEVMVRYATLLTEVLKVAGDELSVLVVGNEIDIYLSGQPQQTVDDYEVFSDVVIDWGRKLRPDVSWGVSITDKGADATMQQLIDDHDTAILTLYDQGNFDGDSQPLELDDLMDELVEFAGDKPLIFKEFGYATGAGVGGSEAGQVAFVEEMFASWDRHAKTIPLLMYSRMYDGERSYCEEQAEYYGLPDDKAFIDFLCTLGLREFDGEAKPAWDAYVTGASARGF